jgi:hypothetical protein
MNTIPDACRRIASILRSLGRFPRLQRVAPRMKQLEFF